MNPRDAAYKALLASMRGQEFIQPFLERWRIQKSPSVKDLSFAREIACGTMRQWLALEHLAGLLMEGKTLKLKRKEKTLLFMSLYQAVFMDRVPLYAIVHESVEMAKKNCHTSFAKFLNALLRKIPKIPFTLPQGDDRKSLSIRYSYPEFFIEEVLKQTGIEKAKEVLEAGNLPGKTMGRIRTTPLTVETFQNPLDVADSTNVYIQNITPVHLIRECVKNLSNPPQKILDLCASPGGKALAVHDLFPDAKLTVNDISEGKMRKLLENFKKYKVSATPSISRGEDFSSDGQYDLIILDVPCSNSGVLGKRPEARWRITPQSLADLQHIQKALLKNALSLLAPEGQVWYMTCSLLDQENRLPELYKMPLFHKLVYPSLDGWDGGFASIITR